MKVKRCVCGLLGVSDLEGNVKASANSIVPFHCYFGSILCRVQAASSGAAEAQIHSHAPPQTHFSQSKFPTPFIPAPLDQYARFDVEVPSECADVVHCQSPFSAQEFRP